MTIKTAYKSFTGFTAKNHCAAEAFAETLESNGFDVTITITTEGWAVKGVRA